MPTGHHTKTSFSPYRKWSIGLNVCLVILLVLAVVVMANYLSRNHFLRLNLSTRSKIQLYPRTLNVLKSLTNHVRVTVFYDKKEPLYTTVVSLLNHRKYLYAVPAILLMVALAPAMA